MSVQSRSENVNTSLFDKREHIEKPHSTCNLLRKVQLFEVAVAVIVQINITVASGVITLFLSHQRDGTVPVWFIQKYLMKKLNFASEAKAAKEFESELKNDPDSTGEEPSEKSTVSEEEKQDTEVTSSKESV
ncbi:transmembrane protein, putative [Medicago truncatula]|uniref:Transmembrane protein, putative n=2 Tax=Medicago truncatula TaxID=3880 RepID=G7IDQ3_MEDTR|nr:transmembrane protein, putative [Medicago truncatula]